MGFSGLASLLFGSKVPKLSPLDQGFPEIEFQFPPQQFREDIGGEYVSQNTMNRNHPILQFVHGTQHQIQFEAKLFAATLLDDIQSKLDKLKDATQADSSLKRPPIWSFTWGNFEEVVVVKSIGNVRYDELRLDGSLRGVLMQITLLRYTAFDIAPTDPGAPLPSTFYVASKRGDEWETVARREYGDALLGDLLRRRRADLPRPGDTPGTVLALLPIERFRNEPIEPDSGPLRRTADGLAARQATWDLRSRGRQSAVLKQ